MASKPLCLVSAGHRPSGRRETNHSNQPTSSTRGVNRNGNSNRNRNWSTPKRNSNSSNVPFPSAARYDKYDSYLDDNDLSLVSKSSSSNNKKGKGKSINHLLSFQSYEETDENKNLRKNKIKNPNSKGYRGSHGKEDYLQATAQFVVDLTSGLELEPFSVDPNIHVPWKFVEAVRIYSQDDTNCPICMSPPIVGKAGRCGHALCFSCVLHLLNVSEYPQCPICHCQIHLSDLRSIITGKEQRPKLSKKLEFVKMIRSKDSTNPAINNPAVTESGNESWLDRHRRVLGVTKEELMKHVTDREEVELVVQREECEQSEIPFVEQAQQLVKQRVEMLMGKSLPPATTTTTGSVELNSRSRGNSQSDRPDVVKDRGSLQDTFKIKNPNFIASASGSDDSGSSPDNDNYYFYQCSDGSPIFISSLNAKCLINQYGSIRQAPEIIQANVLEIEDFTMDHELRRRFRYLSHLSDGKSFSLVLLDSKNLNLNEETFLKFKTQILARNKRREKKDKEETKQIKKIEEFYDRELYGKYAPAEISLSSHEMFPDFENDSIEMANQDIQDLNLENQNLSPTWVNRSGNGNRKSELNVTEDFFPSLGGTGSNSANFASGQTGSFWGAPPPPSKLGPKLEVAPNTESDIDAEYTPPATTDIGSGIAEAINEAAHAKLSNQSTNQRPKRGQKKKKGTKIQF
jgi:hypothetical protein